MNLLRAYDVTSNSFSLNQIGLVIDHAPDPAHGHRAGLRVDLMYGQATDTVQGSAANEPRPQVYRPLFQAYGSYVLPLGSGLQVDFGKFASALGIEGNYTKDQINYSRSYLFDFLPFYHMGFRTTYPVNDRLTLTYWLVNGAQQTEDFNGFKSQAAIITITPAKSVSWNLNYYDGQGRPRSRPAAQSRTADAADATRVVDDAGGEPGPVAHAHRRHLRHLERRAEAHAGRRGRLRHRPLAGGAVAHADGRRRLRGVPRQARRASWARARRT